VEVVAVEPEGPAAQAGIEADDLIVSLGDHDVTSVDDLHKLLTQLPVGMPSSVILIRGQKRLQRFVLPEEYPHWDPAKR
jgi:S1-C subfamily serine protease